MNREEREEGERLKIRYYDFDWLEVVRSKKKSRGPDELRPAFRRRELFLCFA